jgi:hypothetical protein
MGNPDVEEPSRTLRSTLEKNKPLAEARGLFIKIDPDGNRTRVAGMKTLCPRPLDDGAKKAKMYNHA